MKGLGTIEVVTRVAVKDRRVNSNALRHWPLLHDRVGSLISIVSYQTKTTRPALHPLKVLPWQAVFWSSVCLLVP